MHGKGGLRFCCTSCRRAWLGCGRATAGHGVGAPAQARHGGVLREVGPARHRTRRCTDDRARKPIPRTPAARQCPSGDSAGRLAQGVGRSPPPPRQHPVLTVRQPQQQQAAHTRQQSAGPLRQKCLATRERHVAEREPAVRGPRGRCRWRRWRQAAPAVQSLALALEAAANAGSKR